MRSMRDDLASPGVIDRRAMNIMREKSLAINLKADAGMFRKDAIFTL